jgi:triphosphatase
VTVHISQETELCLAGPVTFQTLKSWSAIRGIASKRQQLNAVYFDTEKFELAKSRAGLRLRREAGYWVQTLKTELNDGIRQEWTHRHPRMAAGQLPSISALGLPRNKAEQAKCAKSLNQALSQPEQLEHKFSVEVRRTTWVFRQGQSTIELVLDLGRIQASNQQSAAIQEVELELKSGQEKDLWVALRGLTAHLGPGFQIEPRSKAQRGYGLWHETYLRPSRANVERVKHAEPGHTMRAHLRSAITELVQWLQMVQVSDDPEGIHQSRVNLRRIRTALKLLRMVSPSPQLTDLSVRTGHLAARLGELRNLDVTLERFWTPLVKTLKDDKQLRIASQAVTTAQAELRSEIRRDLLTPSVVQLICDLQIFSLHLQLPRQIVRPVNTKPSPVSIATPPSPEIVTGLGYVPEVKTIGEFLFGRLRKRLKKLTELTKTQEAARHRLRLAYKAMRYASPILSDLGVKARIERLSKEATREQERLGDSQDRAVALETIAKALANKSIEQSCLDYSLAVLRGYLAARRVP